jgi:hypothetical protein
MINKCVSLVRIKDILIVTLYIRKVVYISSERQEHMIQNGIQTFKYKKDRSH